MVLSLGQGYGYFLYTGRFLLYTRRFSLYTGRFFVAYQTFFNSNHDSNHDSKTTFTIFSLYLDYLGI